MEPMGPWSPWGTCDPWGPYTHRVHGAHGPHGAREPQVVAVVKGGACTDTVYRGGPGEASLDRISIATGGLGKVPSVMRPA